MMHFTQNIQINESKLVYT